MGPRRDGAGYSLATAAEPDSAAKAYAKTNSETYTASTATAAG